MSKTWKIVLWVVVILLVVGIVWNYSAKNKNTSENEPIKIGAIYPLTGSFATFGEEYKRGLEMAMEEINANGGIDGRQIKLIVEDDAGDVAKSVNAANKLINADGVKYLFTGFSSQSQATASIAEKNDVLFISQTVSKIGNGKLTFRDYWDIEDQGVAMGKIMKKEGISKLGVLAMNFGDTEYFINSIKQTAGDMTIIEERFNFGDSDFKTQLMKLKSADVDAILVYAFPGDEAFKITKQIQDLGLDNVKLFAGATTYGFQFMYEPYSELLAKMQVLDTWYSLDADNQKSVEFAKKYKDKYGQDLIGDGAYPYDDLYALKEAMEKAGGAENVAKVADRLRKVNIDGVAGPLTFDEKGNSLRQAYLQRYTSEGWQKYNQE